MYGQKVVFVAAQSAIRLGTFEKISYLQKKQILDKAILLDKVHDAPGSRYRFRTSLVLRATLLTV